jgi:hypothetical protein
LLVPKAQDLVVPKAQVRIVLLDRYRQAAFLWAPFAASRLLPFRLSVVPAASGARMASALMPVCLSIEVSSSSFLRRHCFAVIASPSLLRRHCFAVIASESIL